MSELTKESLSHLSALIRARKVSPVEVLEAHLNRIDQLNPMLNAIVTLAPDALENARQAEAAIMRGETKGALHGVPITIKDTIETKGLLTTSGSRVRANYVPIEDAPAVARLRHAGAIILGKTNVAEMAAAYDTENPVFGHTNNPYDLRRTSGGSSGGEAAAIAACMSPGGLGSDLMGSIRVPAHFCGIVGLKPTTGRVPCAGHIPDSTGPAAVGAVIGPMARIVEDVALLFSVIAGLENSESVSRPMSDVLTRMDLRGCRVAWHSFDGVSPVTDETRHAVESAASALANAGLEVREENPPAIEHGQDLWSALFAHATLLQMRREYAGQEHKAGALVRYLLDSSLTVEPPSNDDYSRARIERDQLRATLVHWMKATPLIIAPVGAATAFEHGVRRVDIGGEAVSIFRSFSYSQTFNVFDLPSVCVTVGQSREGLPIGVQIIGRPYMEDSVLVAAQIVEESFGGWRQPLLALPTEGDNPL